MRQAIAFLLIGFSIMMICGVCCSAAQKCTEPANRNTPTCAIVADVVDCTTDNAKVLIDEFGGITKGLIDSHTSADGTVAWSSLEDELRNAGIADGMCVVADVVKELLGRSAASGALGKPKFDSLSIGFDQLRSHLAPGIRFKTPHGVL